MDSLDSYYAERKRYAVGLMIVAELLIIFIIFQDYWADQLRDHPDRFWKISVRSMSRSCWRSRSCSWRAAAPST